MSESTPLVSNDPAAAAAVARDGLVNTSAENIRKDRAEGPLTYRVMAFIGGWAMIASNVIVILERFLSFNYTGCLIAIYGVLFGTLICALEGPIVCSRRVSSAFRYYCKCLEFTWGRGLLYFFVGSLQFSNWNTLDWAIGGWMMFVGLTAMCIGMSTSRKLRLLLVSVNDEDGLKTKWEAADEDGNGTLDVKEVTKFSVDAGLDMSRNEIASAFMALDRNFDEQITFEEFYTWWKAAGAYGAERSVSV